EVRRDIAVAVARDVEGRVAAAAGAVVDMDRTGRRADAADVMIDVDIDRVSHAGRGGSRVDRRRRDLCYARHQELEHIRRAGDAVGGCAYQRTAGIDRRAETEIRTGALGGAGDQLVDHRVVRAAELVGGAVIGIRTRSACNEERAELGNAAAEAFARGIAGIGDSRGLRPRGAGAVIHVDGALAVVGAWRAERCGIVEKGNGSAGEIVGDVGWTDAGLL